MNRNPLMCAILLAAVGLFAGVCSAGQEVIFFDDFSGYKATEPAEQAKELAQKWSAVSGHWYVKDGVLHQDAGSFDYGLLVKDLYLRCDYSIEAEVQLVGGGAGVGFYWNVADQLGGANGNMLRYDGTYPIMYGWMRGNGFVGTGGATGCLQIDGKWHTMRMDVFSSKGTFDLYWDGKKIADGAGMFHRSGYVGLQCSMGHCTFKSVKISVEKGTDWRAQPTGKVVPEWIRSVGVLPDGNYVYPVCNLNRIQIVTPDGKLVKEFGTMGQGLGQLYLPTALSVGGDGKIYVSEQGNNRIQIFSSDGQPLKIVTPKDDPLGGLNRPFGVVADGSGQIWVGDTLNKRVVVMKDDGTIVATIGSAADVAAAKDPSIAVREPGQFASLWHLSFINGKIYVADPSLNRIQAFDASNPAAKSEIFEVPNAASIAYDPKTQTYVVANGRGVSLYDASLKKLIGQYAYDAAGEVWSEQAVFGADGNIVISDWWSHRILITSPKLTPVKPVVSDLTENSATITWDTDLPTATKLMVLDTPQRSTWPSSVDYTKAKVVGDDELTTHHVVKLTGLKSATRHVYAIESPRKIIPAGSHSADFRFCTNAPEGKMAYSEIPIAILCYANVTFESQKDPNTGKVPAPVIRDDEWFQHANTQHEAMRYFYWTNSYFRMDTKCYNYKVTRPVDFGYLGSSSEEVYKDLKALADKEGMQPEDFGAVLVIGGNGTYAYPWPTPWWGGRLTYTTGCCFAGGGDLWLSTHEFHHDTEGWMNMVGELGQGYVCGDTPWCSPGAYGENFDFLGWTLRVMPTATYLNLPLGKIVVTDDKDGDGVPDNEPRACFDEKRGGTDPNNKESYGNGLTDLQNLTAGTFTPAVRGLKHPLVTKQIDLRYPFAIFDYKFERPKKTPKIDGTLNDGEWDEFASSPTPCTPHDPNTLIGKAWPAPAGADYTMKTYLNWDDDYVYFAFTSPVKFGTSVELDGKGDGYFHGRDNPRTYFAIPRDESDTKAQPNTLLPPPGVMVWNNVDPVRQINCPNWTNDMFDTRDKIQWAWGKAANGWYVIEAAIPKCANIDFVPADGQEMGVRFWINGYLPPTEKNPNPVYIWEMFESCEYGHFKLVK